MAEDEAAALGALLRSPTGVTARGVSARLGWWRNTPTGSAPKCGPHATTTGRHPGTTQPDERRAVIALLSLERRGLATTATSASGTRWKPTCDDQGRSRT